MLERRQRILHRFKWHDEYQYNKCCLRRNVLRATIHSVFNVKFLTLLSSDYINDLKFSVKDQLEKGKFINDDFLILINIMRGLYVSLEYIRKNILTSLTLVHCDGHYHGAPEVPLREFMFRILNEYKMFPPELCKLDNVMHNELLFYILYENIRCWRVKDMIRFKKSKNPKFRLYEDDKRNACVEFLYRRLCHLVMCKKEYLIYFMNANDLRLSGTYNSWNSYEKQNPWDTTRDDIPYFYHRDVRDNLKEWPSRIINIWIPKPVPENSFNQGPFRAIRPKDSKGLQSKTCTKK